MLELERKKLNLMKQRCALAEKEFKVLKLQEDIKRIEVDIEIQKKSIDNLDVEIKGME